jgi:hypothetical protein
MVSRRLASTWKKTLLIGEVAGAGAQASPVPVRASVPSFTVRGRTGVRPPLGAQVIVGRLAFLRRQYARVEQDLGNHLTSEAVLPVICEGADLRGVAAVFKAEHVKGRRTAEPDGERIDHSAVFPCCRVAQTERPQRLATVGQQRGRPAVVRPVIMPRRARTEHKILALEDDESRSHIRQFGVKQQVGPHRTPKPPATPPPNQLAAWLQFPPTLFVQVPSPAITIPICMPTTAAHTHTLFLITHHPILLAAFLQSPHAPAKVPNTDL